MAEYRHGADTVPVGDELAAVEVVGTEPEAELLCSLLRSAGIKCMHRPTNQGAGAFDGWSAGGPREILVRAEDIVAAREVLREDSLGEP
jgi:Putative prokaryotic signal transducing protein